MGDPRTVYQLENLEPRIMLSAEGVAGVVPVGEQAQPLTEEPTALEVPFSVQGSAELLPEAQGSAEYDPSASLPDIRTGVVLEDLTGGGDESAPDAESAEGSASGQEDVVSTIDAFRSDEVVVAATGVAEPSPMAARLVEELRAANGPPVPVDSEAAESEVAVGQNPCRGREV